MSWKVLLFVLCSAFAAAQPRRILYITHSAGFRHGSLPVSAGVLTRLAAASGDLQVTATEDLSELAPGRLQAYSAILFFTSGELPVSEAQKQALLDFVRSGKGFGGFHSATDTFYDWPEYGELIGARFNGHPWTQTVRVHVEDPSHPSVSHLGSSFSIQDEIYQFREFSRSRVRVLLTLDTDSVDLSARDTNPGTRDFPLAWVRDYGQGRVFYTALGHFDETWNDPRFQRMSLEAMRWLAGLTSGAAAASPPRSPELTSDGVANAASLSPPGVISPGSIISLFGRNLTAGATAAGRERRLAGTMLLVNGLAATLYFASPTQVNAWIPSGMIAPEGLYRLHLDTAGDQSAELTVRSMNFTPGIFAVSGGESIYTVWATGLGALRPAGDLEVTQATPSVKLEGREGNVLFSGAAPGFPGLYQINVRADGLTIPRPKAELTIGGTTAFFP